MQRELLLKNLAAQINSLKFSHPTRVVINGVDASGKTVFAKELAQILKKQYGRTVIRATIDSFHKPKEERYRRGKDSPEGYYLDSFDNETFVDELLKPLGPKGNRLYKTESFELYTDSKIISKQKKAPDNAILIAEGIFLLKPEFLPHWDLKIFLRVPFNEVIKRAKIRNAELLSDSESVESRYKVRYIPGQEIYLNEIQPEKISDIVIDNSDFDNPFIVE